MQSVENVASSKEAGTLVSRAILARHWLLCWELYIIFGVALFLHFFQLQTTEFDTDQAELFRMAHDAVAHGLIPLTSNNSSINILNPPGFLYFLMPAAALSASPLGGAISIGLFTTAASLLTYIFTRRYFGRLPATIAALLCVTATVPLKYSRGIWQPNILPFFVLLFVFFIYRGAVERRRGWFLPALAVFGIMYQLHPSTLAMSVLIVLALVMAPGTVRWREVVLAGLALLLLLSPYIVWEVLVKFDDIHGLLAFSRLPAKFDTQGVVFYRQLLYPDNGLLPGLTRMWMVLMSALLLAGFVSACVLLLRQRKMYEQPVEQRKGAYKSFLSWWSAVCADPERSAVLLLLVWQIVPLVYISHHAVSLHMQYLLLFLPGPYILIALFLSGFITLVTHYRPRLAMLTRIGVIILASLLIFAQFATTSAYLIKMSSGHYDDRRVQNLPYVNDLHSLMHAVAEADQLAQARHLNRVYVTMDANVQETMTYLGEQLKTPTTVFDATSCLVLPAYGLGPAVLLVGPYADLANTLLRQFASATLVDQPSRLGGQPFKLYIVEPRPVVPVPQGRANFGNALALLTAVVQPMRTAGQNRLVTRWQILRSASGRPRVLYNYALEASLSTGGQAESGCALTSLRQGDQLIVTLNLAHTANMSSMPALTIKGLTFDRVPYQRQIGPMTVTSARTEMINWQHLQALTGGEHIVLHP
ncbi:MAG: hypothetical protein NVS2B12_09280 [Ktedonobacteraceae bacterium]